MKYLLLFVLLGALFGCGGKVAGDGIITYHGGELKTNPINVYVIWYGNWNKSDNTQEVVDHFLNHIDSTTYYNVIRNYYQQWGGEDINAADKIKVVENYYIGSPKGNNLSKGDIAGIVVYTLDEFRLTPDPDGFYLVLTDAEVKVETICGSACGWHDAMDIAGQNIVFSIVANTETQCPKSCNSPKFWTTDDAGTTLPNSPNNNWAADGMVNVIVHELAETITDPYSDGWNGGVINHNVIEIGDKCEWQFGDNVYIADGGAANIKVGKKDYLIQELWSLDDSGGSCKMQL